MQLVLSSLLVILVSRLVLSEIPENKKNDPFSNLNLFGIFPECKPFEKLLLHKRKELITSGHLVKGSCTEGSMECIRKELFYVRTHIKEIPSDDCWQEVLRFLFGSYFDDVNEDTYTP